MQVHHLNCGAMQPLGGALFDGVTPGLGPATLACHCLLLEGPDGLVLVDTGVVGQDGRQSRAAHSPAFLAVDNLRLDPRESAAARIRALGHRAEDVRHIVMTHLDFDHAAGLVDFPAAAVHLSEAEAAAAQRPEGAKAAARYRPGQWGGVGAVADLPAWAELVRAAGSRSAGCGTCCWWNCRGIRGDIAGWRCGRGLGGCSMPGMRCSSGRSCRTGRGCQRVLEAYQWFMETSQVQRRRTLKTLRALVRDAGGGRAGGLHA